MNNMAMEIVVSVILLTVGIAVLVIIHVCIVGRAFGRAFTNGGALTISAQRANFRGQSLSQDEIKKLPCFEYRDVEQRGKGPVECAVCLEPFKVGELLRLLPRCGHSFHVQCIDTWLSMKDVCPICRAGVNSPEVGMEGSRSSDEVSGVELV